MIEHDLILPINKKWYDMILSGEKKEEYRDFKPYWTKRIDNICLKKVGVTLYNNVMDYKYDILFIVKFINGYGADKPYFIAECDVHNEVGWGKAEWGAKPDQDYYVFDILKILEVKNEILL